MATLVGALATGLERFLARGLMLWIDYGYARRDYYHPQRRDGTFICHYRHRSHDNPLCLLGLQDLTAFVDFTAVAEAADACELEVLGFGRAGQFFDGKRFGAEL